jgi:iron complex outermembrane recepter protein
MTNIFTARTGLLACTALASTFLMNGTAQAQAPATTPAAEDTGGIADIIVTAQKREQNLQDVPIAITAITQASLQANRIFSLTDLSALAPGTVIKPTPGGTNVPVITIRGQASIGITPGSEKQVSIYVDGVYIGSPRGSLFSLPDVARLEVLRGPQGTLFGRNATAGAISITTRDPSGEAGVKLEGSLGNYDAYRARVTLETPQIGPFSAYFSYVRNYKRGDIENTGAGVLWDRRNAGAQYGTALSSRWLGTTDTNSYFAAVKYQPFDNLKIIYKFDRDDDTGTPDGTSIAAYDRTGGTSGAPLGNFLTALYTDPINNVQFNPSALRPASVNNAFTVARNQRVLGHSLTATWKVTDNVTLKNIAAYRSVYSFNSGSVAGVGPLTFTQSALAPFVQLSAFGLIGTPTGNAIGVVSPATAISIGVPFLTPRLQPSVGQRIALADTNSEAISKQWSDEVQLNYSSERLQATVGAIWFKSKDETGAPLGQRNNVANFAFIPQTGIIPLGGKGRSFNEATSIAGYVQLEYKVLPTLEIVAGARITRDKKDFSLDYDILSNGVILPRAIVVSPTYTSTNPSFLVGLNWKPNDDLLVYGKFSRSFVSGGSTLGIGYEPEKANSFEVGIKADLLDKKLRTNLAVYKVDYKNAQLQQGTTLPAARALAISIFTPLYGATIASELATAASLFIIDQGTIEAQGFELEVTAAPVRGLTLGGSLGYTDVKYVDINPLLLNANAGRYDVNARPKWTASIYGIYETQPLFGGDATLQFRLDGNYRSENVQIANPLLSNFADGSNIAALEPIKGYMLVNGRVAVRHMKIGGANAELALWGKNLTDRKDRAFGLGLGALSSANFFIPARTFGVDLSIDF